MYASLLLFDCIVGRRGRLLAFILQQAFDHRRRALDRSRQRDTLDDRSNPSVLANQPAKVRTSPPAGMGSAAYSGADSGGQRIAHWFPPPAKIGPNQPSKRKAIRPWYFGQSLRLLLSDAGAIGLADQHFGDFTGGIFLEFHTEAVQTFAIKHQAARRDQLIVWLPCNR
jgi:hypothetical protein